jgi:hypothetical protein
MDIVLGLFSDSNYLNYNPQLKNEIIDSLSKLLPQYPSFFSYSIEIAIIVVIFLVYFRLLNKSSPELKVNEKDKNEVEKIINNIKNDLGYCNIKIKIVADYTCVKRKCIYLSIGDFKNYVNGCKFILFKLHHEYHHMLVMDDYFSRFYEPIFNLLFKISIVILTFVLMDFLNTNFSHYYYKPINILFLFVIYNLLDKFIGNYRFSYRNIRECAADFYAVKKTGALFKKGIIIDEGAVKTFHLTDSERCWCCKGKMVCINGAIVFIFVLMLLFFNPIYHDNYFISIIPYIFIFLCGVCVFFLIFISNKSRKLIKNFIILLLIFLIYTLKVYYINSICNNFDFRYIDRCKAYELY